jgi:hypothetical protein
MRGAIAGLALVCVIPASGDSRCYAATLNVPGEYASIQAGIDAAVPGDTVLVAAGTYSGAGYNNISFRGKALAVCSAYGASHTILNVDLTRGVIFSHGETRGAVLDGFTITDAGFPGDGIGAGIACSNGSCPTIRNCLVAHNEICALVIGRGVGIACMSGANPLLEGCTFAGNLACDDTPGPKGGGVWCYEAAATLVRCIVWGNCGGDVTAQDTSSSIVLTCCAVDPAGIGGAGDIEFVGENVFEDPLFCDPQPCGLRVVDPWEYGLETDSPCSSEHSPCGRLIGAIPVGCPPAASPDRDSAGWGRDRVALGAVSPNPSRGVLSFELVLDQEGRVAASILDAGGRVRAKLVDRVVPGGSSRFTWRMGEADPQELSSGVYYLRLTAAGRSLTREFMVIR